MHELTSSEIKTVAGGLIKESDVIREEGWLWDSCYAKKKDGSKGSRVRCP